MKIQQFKSYTRHLHIRTISTQSDNLNIIIAQLVYTKHLKTEISKLILVIMVMIKIEIITFFGFFMYF